MQWDIFICHASEDKKSIAEPLANALAQTGLRVWYDDLILTLGDSLSQSIDRGLSESQFGVVILSPHFFAKKWPQRELNGLVALEESTDKIILPVWHGVTHSDVAQFSPPLADKISISTTQGVSQVVQSILRVVRPEFFSSIGMEFVLIPAGEFLMGTPATELDAVARRYEVDHKWIKSETPVHKVQISQPFYLGKYLVTQSEWLAVRRDNPSHFHSDLNRPVEGISWEEIQAFIHALNEREGSTHYRLPTEAEWEYACRAGSTKAYCFGDDPNQLGEFAWYRDNSDSKTHPVGQLKPNSWGLYDMHGNVWEWTQDWHGKYQLEPMIDPKGPPSGSHRVFRGGCWSSIARSCRSAFRDYWLPGKRYRLLGFRLLREAP